MRWKKELKDPFYATEHDHTIDTKYGHHWCMHEDCAKPVFDVLDRALRETEKELIELIKQPKDDE